ncbi:MAG: ThiF family adenylyltransferase [Blastocatellia bacterium]|nr:ThiF family adenylyltransferase [Blastocatellia bacterium]MCS7156779.1 ThiF family adenylyltransferase [Blastocatellia bacterium]MCX7752737.1 ThiF family adenylyltransferase [Blastocatellia bacterium]MDW8167469.1 ThiF family adenylyltransferase [Acidobacteriota bacterium]MDW8256816.1 ThiF family adenylyltransferase [Acidobacteriota bacterium]
MNREKYSRQILFREIGEAGQERLLQSRAVIIGCGALGAAQAEMLARAGVGFLRLVDRDFVEESNLHRQIMFEERDAAERLPKAVACARRVERINSDVRTEVIVADVNYKNIERLIADVDVVLDGTDNFETRYLINDACVKHGKPWIYGAAVGSYGLTMTIRPGITPCLRCVFEKIPPPGSSPTCDTAGIILPIILTIASIQVTEALKLLIGRVEKLHEGLIQVDVWETSFHRVSLRKVRESADCPACRHRRFEFLEASVRQSALTLCGRNAVHISSFGDASLDLREIAERLKPLGEVTLKEFLLIFRVNGYELNLFPDGHCIVKGTEDMALARSLYARYIGI